MGFVEDAHAADFLKDFVVGNSLTGQIMKIKRINLRGVYSGANDPFDSLTNHLMEPHLTIAYL